VELQVEKVSKTIGWWSVIVGAALTVWLSLHGYFATRLIVEQHDLKRIEADIDSGEKLRDYYQNKIDNGRVLDLDEVRRHRITQQSLDKLYVEREDTMDLVKELNK